MQASSGQHHQQQQQQGKRRRRKPHDLLRLVLLLVVGSYTILQLRWALDVTATGASNIGDTDSTSPTTRTTTNNVNFHNHHHRFHHFEPDPSLDPHPNDINVTLSEAYWSVDDMAKFWPEPNHPKIIYFVTPTYYNPAQWVNIIRLSQTLMNDHYLYWIIVEDSNHCSLRIRKQLNQTRLPYAHLNIYTEPKRKKVSKGTDQRNRALQHIIETLGENLPKGILYFGDDDNAYDLRLFHEMRSTKRASIGSMAFVGHDGMYERCLVNEKTGKVQKGITNWFPRRPVPVDMGAIAFHTDLILEKKPRFYNNGLGMLETNFTSQLVGSIHELEPINKNCTRIYSWHLKTGGIKDGIVTRDPQFNEIKLVV